MAPKVNCNPTRLASIVAYLQRSRVCHSIKDLEKQLPSVASINGMQVKDYLQVLQDENKITVEKIGSGNWYWSFASQAKNEKQKSLDDAQATYDKAAAVVKELRDKLARAAAATAEGENGEGTREEMMAQRAVLEADIKALKKELAAYSDNDPTELERKRNDTQKLLAEVEKHTDDIQSMESWLSNQHGKEATMQLRLMLYGDEYDPEEEQLMEVVLEAK